MKNGELAKIIDLAPSHIRFYQTSGLVRAVGRKAVGVV